jgi:tetratricopeptide (TPR) repeat protein
MLAGLVSTIASDARRGPPLDGGGPRGRHAALVPGLGELVARYPLREGLRASLMRSLAGSGRQAEAIDTYRELRRRLADELGVDPAPQVRELYASILDGDPQLLAPRPAQAVARPLPAQLLADTSDFTGRRAQVRRLREALAADVDGSASAVVSVVSGPGGIGKSALAVHVAHLLADAFPDGQLFVNLAGMSGSPLAPTDVLDRLLRDLGVGADDTPADEAERAACYRSLLTGRRVLLVLDDARDAAQVRPLLPGAPQCAVLITSRAALADLAGVRRVDLDEMAADEGRELFTRIVGASRAEAEPEATGRLLQSCAGLPLAIRITGAKLASRLGWGIYAMASRLTAQRLRLAELRVGDLAVRASFQLSYHTLGEDSARMFRLLGLAELPVFGASQAGALCGVDGERAERLLDALADAHMLQSPAPGVYRFHDLLRLFAIELAGTEPSPDEGDQAVGRLLLWYAHALRAASLELSRGRSAPPEAEPMTAWAGAQLPEFASHRAAMEWCEREYPALMWAVQEAARRRRPGLAANMACWMRAYATRALTPANYVMCPRIGLECAREIGAEHAQRWLLNCLGSALGRIAEHESAIDCYRQAIDLGRRTGDDAGGAASLNNIANIRHEQGRYADAVAYYLAAAEAAEAAGRPDHIGVILVNAANSNRDMGAYAEALDVYSRALEIL